MARAAQSGDKELDMEVGGGVGVGGAVGGVGSGCELKSRIGLFLLWGC